MHQSHNKERPKVFDAMCNVHAKLEMVCDFVIITPVPDDFDMKLTFVRSPVGPATTAD